MENTKEMRSPGHIRTDTSMNSQKAWQHAQGILTSKSDGVPVLSKVNTSSRTLSRRYLQWKLLTGGNFSPIDSHCTQINTHEAGPMPNSSWLTQNRLSGSFGGFFLSHRTVSGFLVLITQIFLLMHYVFQFYFYGGSLCVGMCMYCFYMCFLFFFFDFSSYLSVLSYCVFYFILTYLLFF